MALIEMKPNPQYWADLLENRAKFDFFWKNVFFPIDRNAKSGPKMITLVQKAIMSLAYCDHLVNQIELYSEKNAIEFFDFLTFWRSFQGQNEYKSGNV